MHTQISLVLLLVVIFWAHCQQPPKDWEPLVANAQLLYAPGSAEPPSHLQTYVGNGYLATQIDSNDLFVAGLFNGPALAKDNPSHRARIPSPVHFSVTNGQVKDAGLALNMGTFLRRTQIGQDLVEQRWYAHRAYKNVLVYELVQIQGANPVAVCVKQDKGPSSSDISVKQVPAPLVTAFTGQTVQPEVENMPLNQLTIVTSAVGSTNQSSGVGSFCTTISRTQPFTYVTIVTTSLETPDHYNLALQLYDKYAKLATVTTDVLVSGNNASQLFVDHMLAISELNQGGIEIAGDLALAQAINSSYYYILSSIRDDWDYSLSPGSLSSNAYNGHVFWDCETWMYPSLLPFWPKLATGILNYRFGRIPEAIAKADSYHKGYSGVMFPWESAQSMKFGILIVLAGVETCPTSAPTGELEQHISGDIVFAARQYYRMQVNKNRAQEQRFALQYLLPIAKGVAQFYASRVTPRPNSNAFDLNGVIPCDEYAVNINNSIYTNVVAQMSFQFANQLVQELDPAHPLPSEWMNIASNLFMTYDAQRNIHPEFEGYTGVTIKQADVVLLGFPLQWKGLQPGSRVQDLLYYENRTDYEGPAMTWGMHAVGFLEQKELDKAAPLFKRSYDNIHGAYKVWTETPTGGAINFITGAGGFLQGVLYGYGGLRIDGPSDLHNVLTFDPQLMPNVNFVRIRNLNFLGHSLVIEYTEKMVTIYESNLSQVERLHVQDNQGNVHILEGEIHLPRDKFIIY